MGETLQHTPIIPPLSDAAYDGVLSNMGFDSSEPSTKDDTNESKSRRYQAIKELRKTVLLQLTDSSLPLAKMILNILDKQIRNPNGTIDNFKIDAFSTGMVLVLRSYDRQLDHALFQRLMALTPEDTKSVQHHFSDVLNVSANNDLEYAINMPRLPESQINLRNIMQRTLRTSSFHDSNLVEMGSVGMYNALASLWPKLVNPHFSQPHLKS